MKNSADLGGCYPPRPSASVYNTLLDLQNSSYPTKAGAHYPECATSTFSCNGVFTSKFILDTPFPRKLLFLVTSWRLHRYKSKKKWRPSFDFFWYFIPFSVCRFPSFQSNPSIRRPSHNTMRFICTLQGLHKPISDWVRIILEPTFGIFALTIFTTVK